MRSAEAARLFKDSSKQAVMMKSAADSSSCFPVGQAEKGRGGRRFAGPCRCGQPRRCGVGGKEEGESLPEGWAAGEMITDIVLKVALQKVG